MRRDTGEGVRGWVWGDRFLVFVETHQMLRRRRPRLRKILFETNPPTFSGALFCHDSNAQYAHPGDEIIKSTLLLSPLFSPLLSSPSFSRAIPLVAASENFVGSAIESYPTMADPFPTVSVPQARSHNHRRRTSGVVSATPIFRSARRIATTYLRAVFKKPTAFSVEDRVQYFSPGSH